MSAKDSGSTIYCMTDDGVDIYACEGNKDILKAALSKGAASTFAFGLSSISGITTDGISLHACRAESQPIKIQ